MVGEMESMHWKPSLVRILIRRVYVSSVRALVVVADVTDALWR